MGTAILNSQRTRHEGANDLGIHVGKIGKERFGVASRFSLVAGGRGRGTNGGDP